MPSSGVRSPRSPASAPSKFDVDALRIYIRKLLQNTLSGSQWPNPNKLDERDRVKAWGKEIGERVKERMLQIEPNGFKYVVTVQINENLGQAGRADLRCHWEDSDCLIQEMFTSDYLICLCLAFAIRTD